MLKLFLKDHVTLKTGVMASEKKSVFAFTEINYILKYIKL